MVRRRFFCFWGRWGKRIGGWACGRIGVVDLVDLVDRVDARLRPVVLDSGRLRRVCEEYLVELWGMEGAGELPPSRGLRRGGLVPTGCIFSCGEAQGI